MPHYFLFYIRDEHSVDISIYYSVASTIHYTSYCIKKSLPTDCSVLLEDPERSLEALLPSNIKLSASSEIVSFNMKMSEAVNLLEMASKCGNTQFFFIGNPRFSSALRVTTAGRIKVLFCYNFGNIDSTSLLVSYLEMNGVRICHTVSGNSKRCIIPEEHVHAQSVLNREFVQAVDFTVTPGGKERISAYMTGIRCYEDVQKSHNFIQYFRHDTTIKNIVGVLRKMHFNISVLSKAKEKDLATSLLIDQSIIDTKSIYSRDNLEERSIIRYKKIIRNVESLKCGISAFDALKVLIEANNISAELLNILRETKEIEGIKNIMGSVMKENTFCGLLADKIAYVVDSGVDAYLDICRKMYEERLLSCQQIIDEIQAAYELDMHFSNEREVCLVGKGRIALEKDKQKTKTKYKLFIIKESKTAILYSTKELRSQNKAIREFLDQIIEIQGRICKSILLRLEPYVPFFVKVSNLIAELDVQISNLEYSKELGFKKPKISTKVAIYGASHVLFPDFQNGDYLFETGTYVITGANMAGKSCYVKNFVYIAILARMGCYIECESVEIPIFDEIYFIESIADVNQLTMNVLRREIDIHNGYQTPYRLVVVDELHCATKVQVALLELLRQSNTIALFVTHRTELIDSLKARGYEIHVYEGYKLKNGVNTQSNVLKICEKYFPELTAVEDKFQELKFTKK